MLVPSYNGYGVPGTGMPPAPADGTVAAYPSRHRGPAPHISPQPGLRPVHKRTSCMIHTLVCSVEDRDRVLRGRQLRVAPGVGLAWLDGLLRSTL